MDPANALLLGSSKIFASAALHRRNCRKIIDLQYLLPEALLPRFGKILICKTTPFGIGGRLREPIVF
jgi:hypothetical protein